jgi:nitrite reductase/ring-hydroxylating ferredoxin subunit
MAEFEAVLRTPELGPGEMREVEAQGTRVVVANVGQTYYAVEGACPVEGAHLGREGRLRGYVLVCPTGHAEYDVRTGERVSPEEGPGLRRYAVRVEANEIKIGPPLEA